MRGPATLLRRGRPADTSRDRVESVLRASAVTARGDVRATNEDFFAVDESLDLCVVADGMGGHNAGEVAARMAVEAIVEFVRRRAIDGVSGPPPPAQDPMMWPFGYEHGVSLPANLLRNAVHAANLAVLRAAGASDAFAGMGTTIVAVLATQDRATIAHAGDSRFYLVRRGSLRQLTLDDTWAAKVLGQDHHSVEVARHHPMRHALTNVVGHVIEEPLRAGDLLILTTDGVHGSLEAAHLERLLASPAEVDLLASGLVDAALANGSRDNCTAVVARYLPD
jgi:protein phosphatase